MKRDRTISEQKLTEFLRKFPVPIGVEKTRGDSSEQGSYTWWVAGEKGTAATFLEAAQAAVAEAFLFQERISHREELYENKRLREELQVLVRIGKLLAEQESLGDILAILPTYKDVLERVERLLHPPEETRSESVQTE